MFSIVESVKLRWHMDLVSHPATHLWVLNLYRAGEEHPQTVEDYFPHVHAPCPELASNMRRHAGDERRHTALYGKAIAAMGGRVEQLSGWHVFNQVIRAHTPLSFAIQATDGPDQKRRRVAHFLAHAHHLERRIERSLSYHAEACQRAAKSEVAELVAKVAADEHHHLSYTKDAVFDLLPRREAAEVMALHARAEAAADKAFSAYQVRSFMRRYQDKLKLTHRAMYCIGAMFMEGK